MLTLYGMRISSCGSRFATVGPCDMKRNPSATNCLCRIIGPRITDRKGVSSIPPFFKI